MEELPIYAHKRTKVQIKIYGIGSILNFLYNYFFFVQVVLFVVGCFCYRIGQTFPLFLFVIVEGVSIWFQYKAPLVDADRREAFTKWVNDSIVQSGSESCNFLNQLLKACWEKMLPDNFAESAMPIADRVFGAYVPFFINYLHFTNFSIGYSPPRILQIVTDQANTSETPSNSMTLQAAVLFANELRFRCTFKILRLIPCDLYADDIVVYAPLKLIIEAPEENKFLNTSIITAIAVTAVQPIRLLHANIYFNGFNASKLPLVRYLIGLFFERQANSLITNEECVVWDWITNTFSFRHTTRPWTSMSNELFSGIATESKIFDKLTRFSMPNEAVQRYDETRKMYYERTYKVQLAPNEKLIQMSPANGAETEPVFFYREEKKESVDVEVQVDTNTTCMKKTET